MIEQLGLQNSKIRVFRLKIEYIILQNVLFFRKDLFLILMIFNLLAFFDFRPHLLKDTLYLPLPCTYFFQMIMEEPEEDLKVALDNKIKQLETMK